MRREGECGRWREGWSKERIGGREERRRMRKMEGGK